MNDCDVVVVVDPVEVVTVTAEAPAPIIVTVADPGLPPGVVTSPGLTVLTVEAMTQAEFDASTPTPTQLTLIIP